MTVAAARARPMGMLAVVTLLTVAPGTALMSTAVGRQALVDDWERTAAALGREVDDAGYARLRSLSSLAPVYAAGRGLLLGPVLACGAAALIALTFGRRGAVGSAGVTGQPDRPPFTAAVAVAAHAWVPLALREAIAAPVNYVRESVTNAVSLGSWAPSLDAASAPARVLGALDPFGVWSAVLLAIGASVLYGVRLRTALFALLAIYGGAALLVAIALWVAAPRP